MTSFWPTPMDPLAKLEGWVGEVEGEGSAEPAPPPTPAALSKDAGLATISSTNEEALAPASKWESKQVFDEEVTRTTQPPG